MDASPESPSNSQRVSRLQETVAEMIPFMVLSDAPIRTTGLGRITRELLKRMRMDPETAAVFRVASLGCGQRYFKSLPYPQYPTSVTSVEADLRMRGLTSPAVNLESCLLSGILRGFRG